MKPNAKKLIMGLLMASNGRPLTVREAISACALFSITENNVRVSLARMSSEGLIESRGRGAYGFGKAAITTASEVSCWHDAEAQLCDWSGAFICVHSASLGRSDRKALHRRERALQMLGLRELDRGLHVRPDNLKGGAYRLRERLLVLGLEIDAAVFKASEFDDQRQARINTLWDSAALNQYYREEHQRLEKWMEGCAELEPDVAARESYLMGGAAIRQLVFDPWLPEPMIDANARHNFVETVKRFDETGKAIWNSFGAQIALSDPMPVNSTATTLSTKSLQ